MEFGGSSMSKKSDKSYRKKQRNLVPIYSKHLRLFQDLVGKSNVVKMLNEAYKDFQDSYFFQQQNVSYITVLREAKRSENEEISDKLAIILLHVHNEVLKFMPTDYPKKLIDSLVEVYQDDVDFSKGFKPLLDIQNIYQPLNYPILMQLGFLLGLSFKQLQRIFTDSPDEHMCELFDVTNETRDSEEDPNSLLAFINGYRDYTQFMKEHDKNLYQQFFIKDANTGLIVFNDEYLNNIKTPEDIERHSELYPLNPYLSLRFWYAFGKLLKVYDANQAYKKINNLKLDSQLASRYEQLKTFYLR